MLDDNDNFWVSGSEPSTTATYLRCPLLHIIADEGAWNQHLIEASAPLFSRLPVFLFAEEAVVNASFQSFLESAITSNQDSYGTHTVSWNQFERALREKMRKDERT